MQGNMSCSLLSIETISLHMMGVCVCVCELRAIITPVTIIGMLSPRTQCASITVVSCLATGFNRCLLL